MAKSEVENYAKFDKIRYANVWEDADVVVAGLAMRPGGTYLSIASAGDNALAMLSQNPEQVHAVDLSAAQIACTELKIAAYRHLEYEELLGFLGVRAMHNRGRVYRKLRQGLSPASRDFFARNGGIVGRGIVHAGKFEHYFSLFRRFMLPLVHGHRTVEELQLPKAYLDRARFYYHTWDTLRWRSLFQIYFSRRVMGMLGRDKAFFRYVDEDVAQSILKRVEYALIELDPAENPWLRFILQGTFGRVLPPYLQPEKHGIIRRNLDRLQLHTASLESFLEEASRQDLRFDGYNLSDIFEYMSETEMETLYRQLLQSSRSGARLVYWNMMAPRRCPAAFSAHIAERREQAAALFRENRTFFYRALVIDEVL